MQKVKRLHKMGAVAKKKPTSWTAKKIKALRLRLDLTQAAAAKKVGVTRRQWAAWEANESTPSGSAGILLQLLAEKKI